MHSEIRLHLEIEMYDRLRVRLCLCIEHVPRGPHVISICVLRSLSGRNIRFTIRPSRCYVRCAFDVHSEFTFMCVGRINMKSPNIIKSKMCNTIGAGLQWCCYSCCCCCCYPNRLSNRPFFGSYNFIVEIIKWIRHGSIAIFNNISSPICVLVRFGWSIYCIQHPLPNHDSVAIDSANATDANSQQINYVSDSPLTIWCVIRWSDQLCRLRIQVRASMDSL